MLVQKNIVHSREFEGNLDISVLRISEECEKIKDRAFANCTNLTYVIVEMSDKPIAIELSAFKGCKNLVMLDTDRPVRFYTDFYARRNSNGQRKSITHP